MKFWMWVWMTVGQVLWALHAGDEQMQFALYGSWMLGISLVFLNFWERTCK